MPGPYTDVGARHASPGLLIHIRIRPPLLFRDLHGRPDLNQRTLANPWAILRRTIPLTPALDQLRPVRERPALRRLGRMYGAAMSSQERALFLRRFAEPHLVARAVYIFFLECLRRQADKLCGSFEVGFR